MSDSTSTIDFSTLFAPHVHGLKRKGDLLEGSCPFCRNQRPSFCASRVTGTWGCSACGKKGDVEKFEKQIGERLGNSTDKSQKDPGGRPRLAVSRDELMRLRAQRMSWRRIGQHLGIGASTAFHLWQDGITPKAREKPVQKPRGDDSGG